MWQTDRQTGWTLHDSKDRTVQSIMRKIMENDLKYGRVWKSHGKCDCWPGKLRCSLHWWLFQNSEYAASMIDKERDCFVNFDPVKSRVDILMHETMAGKDMYSKLWNVVRMLLVLSHGQAAVKRDFSMNKQAEVHLQADLLLPRELYVIMWGMWVALTRLM